MYNTHNILIKTTIVVDLFDSKLALKDHSHNNY